MADFITAHAAAERTLRRHRQEPRDFAVEADGQWPMLHTAFEVVSHDGGNSAGHAVYFVPEGWTDQLDQIEAALARLSPDDFDRFCLPTDDEDGLIAGTDAALHAANRLLGAFFEDWAEDAAIPSEVQP